MISINNAGLLVSSLLLFISAAAMAAEPYAGYGYEQSKDGHIGEKEYSPFLNIGYPQRPYFGDTHNHTSYSTDAGMVGNRIGPDEAYRFARGEIVTSSIGVRTRLQRPLDFLVAKFFKVDLPKGVPTAIQDRAYTSPIWYTP